MDPERQSTYRGPVKAVIFDWAGTTVDFGCCAPASVFVEVFRRRGITLTIEEARGPMGMHKRDHIRALLALDPIAAQWSQRHGRSPNNADLDALFEEFVPLQIEAIRRHADLIPGTLECVAALRERGIRIGSTTGYNDAMMAALIPETTRAGYRPDAIVCVSDVPEGRPAPWMALEAAKRVGAYPVSAIVKVGDTPADVAEGLNAGMWTIAVVEHGNEVGLSQSELAGLDPVKRDARLARARERLRVASAHDIAETIADVPGIVDTINARLARGERP
jgi:phosphonoacetaldehyde hydrolase